MKKISIFSILLAGVVAFSACTAPDIEPAAAPITYKPVDSAFLAVNATPADFASPIDLGTYEADLISAYTVDLTATPELGEGDKVSYKIHTSATEDMASVKDLAVTVEGNTLKVSKEELNEVMKSFFGKRPAQNVIYTKVRTIVTASTGANIEFITEVTPVTVTSTTKTIIEEVHYITYGDKTKKMQHSTTDVYEDPVFFVTITTTEDNTEWYVNSESGVKFGQGEGEGTLAVDGNNLVIEKAGIYTISVNVETLTYSMEEVEQKAQPKPYWFVGGFNGWNNNATGAAAGLVPMSFVEGFEYDPATGAGEFVFTAYLEAGLGYKLILNPGSWDEQIGHNGTNLVFNDGSSKDITVDESGYYDFVVNSIDFTASMEASTATPTEHATMEFVGSFEGWGTTPIVMTAMNMKHMWYAQYTFTEDCEGKFRTDNTWSVNWGKKDFPFGIAVSGGDNIMITAGTYDIIFNDANGCYYFLPVE